MKYFSFLQIIGFTLEVFSFIAIVISMVTDSGSRGPLYLLFLAGVICVVAGKNNKQHRK